MGFFQSFSRRKRSALASVPGRGGWPAARTPGRDLRQIKGPLFGPIYMDLQFGRTCPRMARRRRVAQTPLHSCRTGPMSTYRLDKLFAPRSVALVGASPRATSVGRAVLRNLRGAGFEGPIASRQSALCRDRRTARGASRSRRCRSAPDLVVIAAPPASVPDLIAAGRRARHRRRDHHHRRASAMDRARSPSLRAGGARDTACGSSDPTASACWCRAPTSMPASRRACRRPAISRSISQSGAIAAGLVEWAAKRSRRLLGDRLARRQDRRRFRRPARLFRARSPARARSCSTSNRSTTRASSCRRRAPPRASSRWW